MKTLDEIFKPKKSLDDIFAKNKLLPITDEQREKDAKKAKEWREKVMPRTLGDAVSEFMVTNPVSRQVGFGLQGITNAGLNPAGYISRALGMDTKPLEAQTDAERITELAGQYGYDGAVIATLLKGYAPEYISGSGLTGNVTRELAKGGIPLALATSTGSAAVTGYTNPKNPYIRMLTDTIGGGVAGGVAMRPNLNTATKSEAKSIKQLIRELGQDVLDENMEEAKRTGRSLLEVGGDEVVQAAQKARQQSPEARKILNKRALEILESQPARTRGAIDEALGSQGKGATLKEVIDSAKRQAQPIYNELEKIGDLETYEIAEKFKNLPMSEREILGIRRPEEYESILREQAKKAGVKLYEDGKDGITHFLKDSQRRAVVNTLDDTLKNPDISAWSNSPQGVPTKYTMKKYIGDKGKASSLYDIVMQQKENEVFNKFPRSSARDAAKSFKAPVSDLSAKDSLLNDMRTNLSSFGNNNISRIGALVNQNNVISDAVKSVKRGYSSFRDLPDTDTRVLLEARKLLSKQTISQDPTLSFQAKAALSEFDPVFNSLTGGKLTKANSIYHGAHQFEEAADLGRGVFNQRLSPDDFKATIDGLSTSEKRAAEIGLRDELLNKIGSSVNENIAAKKFLAPNVREKIIAIAGEKGGNKIIDEAEQAVAATRNVNKLLSGSQTSEKQSLRDVLKGIRGFIKNPWDKTVDAVFMPFDSKRNIKLADYLTNPDITDSYNSFVSGQARNAQRMQKRIPYLQSGLRSILETIKE